MNYLFEQHCRAGDRFSMPYLTYFGKMLGAGDMAEIMPRIASRSDSLFIPFLTISETVHTLFQRERGSILYRANLLTPSSG